MHQQIYVNLPVKDLARSQSFFQALGYRFNPQFTNEHGAALELGPNLYAMLLAEPFARTFTPKAFPNPREATTGWVCLSCDSPEQVDTLVARAVAAGGTTPSAAKREGLSATMRAENSLHSWASFVANATSPK